MPGIQETSTEGCSNFVYCVFCCFSRQSTPDAERQPLLGQMGPSSSNSEPISNLQDHHSTTNSVNQDHHGRHAFFNEQENGGGQAKSVKHVNQATQTHFFEVNEESKTNSVQKVNLESSSQTTSVQLANQESQTCPVLIVNQQYQNTSEPKENLKILKYSEKHENLRYHEPIEQEYVERQPNSTEDENKAYTRDQSCKRDDQRINNVLMHSDFYRCLECQYDLLDHLQHNGCITVEDANELKQGHVIEKNRNSALINLINSFNIDSFKIGLEKSNQRHLVNFINKNGKREPPEEDDWPANDSDIAPIIKSYPDLVLDLDNMTLMDQLFAKQCLTAEQKNAIRSKITSEERNRELLSIIMRRSVRHLKIFINCLERNYADILSQSQDKGLFTVDFDDATLAKTAEEIDELLRRNNDSNFEYDVRLLEGKLYFVSKSAVDEGVEDKSSESSCQSENAIKRIKIASDLLVNDAGCEVQVKRVLKKDLEENSAYTKSLFRKFSTVNTANIIRRGGKNFKGVAVVDDEIFVISSGQSRVYAYDLHSLTQSRYINIPDIQSPEDLAGCTYNKALYISDYKLMCIHKFQLTSNSVTRWKMGDVQEPRGLSVTAEHTLLVTVRFSRTEGESGVVEYTSEGQQLREIKFEKSISEAWQTIQLSSEHYIASHGWYLSTQHRICVINTEGNLIKSYGEGRGGDEGQLSLPYAVAIDGNCKNVFVADHCNNRVLLLDTDLTYLGQVCGPRELTYPYRMCFDSATGRLFVAEEGYPHRLLVIRLSD